MNNDLIQNIISGVKQYLGISADATNTEVHQKLSEVAESQNPQVLNQLAENLAGMVETKATELYDKFAADLQTKTNEALALVDEQMKKYSEKIEALESVNLEEKIDARIASIRTEFGQELNTIKGIKAEAKTDGDTPDIKTHTPIEKVSKLTWRANA